MDYEEDEIEAKAVKEDVVEPEEKAQEEIYIEELMEDELEDEEIEYEGPPSTLLLVVGIISLVAIAVVFVYIFILTDWHISHKFWWSGFASFIIALLFYILYAYTSMGDIAKPMTAALFTMGVVLIYLALWFMEVVPEDEGKKVIGIMVITVIIIIIFLLLLYSGLKARQDIRKKKKSVKVLKAKRKE